MVMRPAALTACRPGAALVQPAARSLGCSSSPLVMSTLSSLVRGLSTLSPLLAARAVTARAVTLVPSRGFAMKRPNNKNGSRPKQARKTNKLKAKLKAKHKRAKGGSNPRGKSQLVKGQRKSRKKAAPGFK